MPWRAPKPITPGRPSSSEGQWAPDAGGDWLRVWVPRGPHGLVPVPVITGASDERFTVLVEEVLHAGDSVFTGYDD